MALIGQWTNEPIFVSDGIKHSHAHFVNVPPKNASKADLQAILSANKASLYKTYQALSQSKVNECYLYMINHF